MPTLFASRFLRVDETRAIDLATGEAVTLQIAGAGTREEQGLWSQQCIGVLGTGGARILIDFGFAGRTQRFEAFRRRRQKASSLEVLPVELSVANAVEWADEGASLSRVLRLTSANGCTQLWLEGVARQLRSLGFVPVSAAMLQRRDELPRLLAGRSVILFDDRGATTNGANDSCVSILKLASAGARAISVLVTGSDARSDAASIDDRTLAQKPVLHAAERRPSYGAVRRTPVLVDSRATAWLEEGRRSMNVGRHAAAERAFRAAAAAFERRGDTLHAADALVAFGRLLLARGRAAEAAREFGGAREKFQSVNAGKAAVSACLYSGLAETDTGRFDLAETTLRAAFTSANALGEQDEISAAGVALARNFYWQRRFAEGLRLLESLERCDCPRYWSLLARLHLAMAHFDGACQCANRARDALVPGRADLEAVVRTAQAMVQARLGDIDALQVHAQAGLAAARQAHLPLQALRIRLTLIDGLLGAGLQSRANVVGRVARAFNKARLPSLLKDRIDQVLERLVDAGAPAPERLNVFRARETASAFPLDHAEGVAELLSVCQRVEHEHDALVSVAEIVRRQTGAVAVGIYGLGNADPVQHVAAGTIGSATAKIARRCMELGQPLSPERGASGVQGAAPVLHLGRIVGSIVLRWTVEGPRGAQEAVAFARIAAAACAPLLELLRERQCVPSQDNWSDALELIGTSAAIQEVRRTIARAANVPFAVLIEGESGTGKELVARAIHRAGCRRDKALRALNCAALTEELVDSELFGHAKGAFTGAVSDRLGLFESAEGGTVFLDEVGELSGRAQAKLLRVLQEGEIRRIGENFTRPIDSRLIAATNRSLATEVQAGRFRQDLLYRLDVIRVAVPALRDRVEDIALLAARFWRDATERIGSKAVLGQAAVAALARYDWPGNVRELQNVLASLAVSVPVRGVVPASAMPSAIAHALKLDAGETLDAARRRFDERFVRAALARSAGHRGQTASALGLSRQGLAKLMQRFQLP